MHPHVPLEVIWSGVAVGAVRAERAHVAGRAVGQAVADHFVFALEALAALGAGAAGYGAVMRSIRRVGGRVGAGSEVSTTRFVTERSNYLRRYWGGNGDAVQPG